MALDINGYNATFKAFTDFATQSVEAGQIQGRRPRVAMRSLGNVIFKP